MTKSMITRSWIGGLVVFATGIVVAIVGVFLMLAYGGTFTQIADTSNYDFTPDMNGFFWTTIGVIVVGGVIALIGSIVQLAAWIGALVNSYMLPEKAWFLILLLGGLLSIGFAPIGFAVMVAYVIAAPDGVLYRQTQAPTKRSNQGLSRRRREPSMVQGRISGPAPAPSLGSDEPMSLEKQPANRNSRLWITAALAVGAVGRPFADAARPRADTVSPHPEIGRR